MAKFLSFSQCPKCAENGRDKSADNLGVYSDGSGHCFSCGFHIFPKFTPLKKEESNVSFPKEVLPRDFTRDVPTECWKWLLQYGLSYSYWKAFTGYSPKENRLILTYGEPVKFSIGRAFNEGDRKWKMYGDGHKYVETFGEHLPSSLVIVEDLISAHKVGQVAPCFPLFGTNVHEVAIKEAKRLKRPVILWLDNDQYSLLPKKIHTLQSFLEWPVWYVRTEKDPKEYTLSEIKEILNDC